MPLQIKITNPLQFMTRIVFSKIDFFVGKELAQIKNKNPNSNVDTAEIIGEN